MSKVIYFKILDTENKRAQGLMNYTYLPPDSGMLFVFDYAGDYPFWMKNTYIPLDIIFMDDNFRVVSIAYNTQPMSEEFIRAGVNYKYAMEVNAGYANFHNIQIGSKFLY